MDSALKGLFGGGDDQGDVRQSMGNNPLEGLFGGGDDDQVRSNARDFIGRYEDGDPVARLLRRRGDELPPGGDAAGDAGADGARLAAGVAAG